MLIIKQENVLAVMSIAYLYSGYWYARVFFSPILEWPRRRSNRPVLFKSVLRQRLGKWEHNVYNSIYSIFKVCPYFFYNIDVLTHIQKQMTKSTIIPFTIQSSAKVMVNLSNVIQFITTLMGISHKQQRHGFLMDYNKQLLVWLLSLLSNTFTSVAIRSN